MYVCGYVFMNIWAHLLLFPYQRWCRSLRYGIRRRKIQKSKRIIGRYGMRVLLKNRFKRICARKKVEDTAAAIIRTFILRLGYRHLLLWADLTWLTLFAGGWSGRTTGWSMRIRCRKFASYSALYGEPCWLWKWYTLTSYNNVCCLCIHAYILTQYIHERS